MASTYSPPSSGNRAVGCFAVRLRASGSTSSRTVTIAASARSAAAVSSATVRLTLASYVPSCRWPGRRMPRACSNPTVMPCAHHPSTPCSLTSQLAMALCVQVAASGLVEEGEPLRAIPARGLAHRVVADALGVAPDRRAHASTLVRHGGARKVPHPRRGGSRVDRRSPATGGAPHRRFDVMRRVAPRSTH